MKEGKHAVGGLEPKGSCVCGRQLLKGPLLCCEVSVDVHVRGLDTLVTEPEGDDADVDAGLQQMCRGRVLWGIRPFREKDEYPNCQSKIGGGASPRNGALSSPKVFNAPASL